MRFDSLQFIGFCFIAVALLRIAPVGRFRDLTILGLNAFFLSSYVGDPLQLIPLLLFVAVGYGMIRLAPRVGRMGVAPLLLLVVAAFVWLKRYSAIASLPFLEFPYLVIGLSYILFRILHLVIDVYQGALRIPRLVDYLNYIFFFPTFVSGPIQRFQDYVAQATKPQIISDTLSINLTLERVIRGYFMIIVVCAFTAYFNEKLAKYFYASFATGLSVRTIMLYMGLVATQLTHLYFNFAGYMHICIGIGNLVGFALPENFNEPHKAKNFLDFWSRWHITLSEWFKFYLFNPILKVLSFRWGSPKNTPYLGALAFFVTFLVMGIWHGTTIVFVFYGLLLASGVTVNKLWQIQATKWLGKEGYKRLCLQSRYMLLSRAATLSFFAIALTCIWIDPSQVEALASLRGMVLGAVTFFSLSAFFAVFMWVVDRACQLFNDRRLCVVTYGNGLASSAWIAVKIFVLANFSIVLGNSAPEFVYKAF